MLDGFPRTLQQAEWLLEQVGHGRFDVDMVFNLVASQDVLRERLHARGRMDDTDEAIARRFEEYERVTRPIIDLYKANGIKVFDIDASKAPQEVHDDMLAHVEGIRMAASQ